MCGVRLAVRERHPASVPARKAGSYEVMSAVKRSAPRRSDPEKIRAWQRRSRDRAIAKARGLPRNPIARTSVKQRTINRERVKVKQQVALRDGLACWAGSHGVGMIVACGSWRPDRPTLELHEVVKRSRWRGGAIVASNVILLCQNHHDLTESEPAYCTAVGLLARKPS